MKKPLLWLLLLVAMLASQDLLAQQRVVTGRVVSSDGGSIPGVTVLLKGGSQGTATGADGKYSLPVPPTANTLVFSFVGYTSQEVALGNRSSVDVTLVASTADLEEVVVVGYGTQSRRELTGSVATVTGKEIANLPVQSFDQALQGRAAGVNITTPNGVLNNPPVVRIRGANSIALSSSPLYVIDGIPTYSGNTSAVGSVPNNPLANIAPEDIENLEVLKDASATAIYGSRANGGVILVTTKKGRKGQARLNYDTWVGITRPVRLYDILGAQDYVNLKNESVRNLNANRAAIGAAATNVEGFKLADANGNAYDTRWYDYIYRTGFSHNHNLSFSGGTDKTTYLASVGYSNQKGMLVRNDFRRYSARANVEHKLFDRLTVGARVNYSNSFNSAPNSGSVGDGAFGTAGLGRLPLVLPPNISPFNPDGTYNTNGAGIGAGPNTNPSSTTGAPLLPGYYNPAVDLDNNYFTSESNQLQGALYADLELVKGLHLRTQYGVDNLNFEDKSYNTSLAGDGYSAGGSASDYYRTNKRRDWQNTAQYDLTAGVHNFSLLAGNEQQYTDVQRWGSTRTQVADPFFTTFQGNYLNIAAAGNSQGSNYLVSFFGRFTYNYNRKYLLTATGRRDGYSAWAQKFGNFYGLSAGYIVSEESFWKNSGFAQTFDFLKLSGSFGTTGNNQGIFDYVSLPLYGSFLYGNTGTFYYAQGANPNITWEKSKKTDASLAFGFLQSRLTGDVTFYYNLIDGLILDVPQAPSRGIPSLSGPGTLGNSISANVGSMRNRGFEANLRFDVLRSKALSWTVSGNLTTLNNKVLSLLTDDQRIAGSTSSLETANYTTVGRSIGSILAVPNAGVNPLNGQRMLVKADGTVVQYNHLGTTGAGSTGWTRVSDGANVSSPTQLTDGVYYGPVLPTFYGGLDNTFRYKGIDLGVFVQYSGGNYIYNGTKAGLHDQRFWNNRTDIKQRWTSASETPNAEWPRLVYGDNVSNGSTIVMSQNVEKGDFIRLRNVSLGYTFASKALSSVKLSSARVYVQVQNAALITKYSGIDPEISVNGGSNLAPGVDRNSVGQARTYTAGLNVSF